MKGVIRFKDGHWEDIFQHIGFVKAGLFVTQSGTYMRTDETRFYRYIKDFDVFIPCSDIATVELEEV